MLHVVHCQQMSLCAFCSMVMTDRCVTCKHDRIFSHFIVEELDKNGLLDR